MTNTTTWAEGGHRVVVCVEEEWAYLEVVHGYDLDAGWANRVLGLYGFELMDPEECEPEYLIDFMTHRYWAARIDGGSE